MISKRSIGSISLFLVTWNILVQSVPVKPSIAVLESTMNDVKKKRNLDEIPTQLSDVNMNPSELFGLGRKHQIPHMEQRRKRSLSSYELYNTNPFYESPSLARSTRSFGPMFWYPSSYIRHIRSDFLPSDWDSIYPKTMENDDIDEDQIPFYINDDDDDDDGEYNRYPILPDSSNIPYHNLQLQQKYSTDDLPLDDDDDGYFSAFYGSLDDYFK